MSQPIDTEDLRKAQHATEILIGKLTTMQLGIENTLHRRRCGTATGISEADANRNVRDAIYKADEALSAWYTATAPFAKQKFLIHEGGRE